MRRDDVRIEAFSTPPARLGESPVWLPASDEVLWVDMPAGLIHLTATSTCATRTIETPTYLGAVAPTVGGGYIVACREGFATITDGGSFEVLWPILSENQRMNDAQCDPQGRLIAGSLDFDFAPGEGRLWSLTDGEEPRLLLDGLTQPNGLAWSPDGATFYLIDSAQRELSSFDVDPLTGTISGRRLVRAFPEAEGYADGMTVDAAGCLLVAMWGAGAIVRLAPDGELLDRIPVPVQHPTSCAFVGEALDQLVVTSANEGSDDPLDYEESGAVTGGSLLLISGLPGHGRVRPRFGHFVAPTQGRVTGMIA
jgi:sugar lactone lactonase YvrE